MQNSIKISNELFGETTFSGGVSTTNDKRLGAEEGEGGGSDNTKYFVIGMNGIDPKTGKQYTNGEVFELMKTRVVIFDNHSYISSAYQESGKGDPMVYFTFRLDTTGASVSQDNYGYDEDFSIIIQPLV